MSDPNKTLTKEEQLDILNAFFNGPVQEENASAGGKAPGGHSKY